MKTPSLWKWRSVVSAALLSALFLCASVWFGYMPGGNGDSDNDGVPDWLEQLLGLDPLVTNNGGGDADADGIRNTNDFEYGNHLIVTVQPVAGERVP